MITVNPGETVHWIEVYHCVATPIRPAATGKYACTATVTSVTDTHAVVARTDGITAEIPLGDLKEGPYNNPDLRDVAGNVLLVGDLVTLHRMTHQRYPEYDNIYTWPGKEKQAQNLYDLIVRELRDNPYKIVSVSPSGGTLITVVPTKEPVATGCAREITIHASFTRKVTEAQQQTQQHEQIHQGSGARQGEATQRGDRRTCRKSEG